MDTGLRSTYSKPYQGVVVPMVTPFTHDGKLDGPAARRVIDHLIDGGVHGIFVLGTTGENASIPLPMRTELVELAVDQVRGRALLYAGISHNCLAHSVQAAESYFRLGANVVVAHLPCYYALTPKEQLAYYMALVRQIDGPLAVYNIPSTTHISIPIEIIEQLSGIEAVVGVKDSENNPSRLVEELAILGGKPGFSVFVGAAALSAKALPLGADGIVPSAGNLVPGLSRLLYESGIAGDVTSAERYQQAMDRVSDIYRRDRSLAQSLGALKAAMSALSLCGPDVLSPLRPPDANEQAAIRREFIDWQSAWSLG